MMAPGLATGVTTSLLPVIDLPESDLSVAGGETHISVGHPYLADGSGGPLRVRVTTTGSGDYAVSTALLAVDEVKTQEFRFHTSHPDRVLQLTWNQATQSFTVDVGATPPALVTTAPSGGATLVSWPAVSGATGYRVFRRRDGFPSFDLVATVAANALSWLAADDPWSGSLGVPPAQFAVSTLLGTKESAFSVIVTNNDQDGDGLSDAEEAAQGTSPTLVDTDGDGLGDWWEVQIGTNPLNPDTDGDGLSDGAEYRVGSDPQRADVTTGPTPEIAAMSPAATLAGQGLTITVDGAGFFTGVSVVQVAGQAVPTTFVNGGQLQATVSQTVLCPPGPCAITVNNPSPGGGLSNVFTLNVQAAQTPTVTLDRTSLTFAAVTTGAAFTSQTSAQAVRLTQTGGGTVTWTAASTTPWLVVSPISGSGSATLTIATQFVSGLTASQTGSITLTFTGAGNTAGPITVTLQSTAVSTAPTGSFDTPIDGTSGVTGSIAVTGWAMDDVEVTGVRILRDPVAGEPAGTLVFIGNAVLVDGARPDVQAAFPNTPRNTRAGWGYLMLTNFLPGLGNGTFKLTAIADDADGHATVLGSKTITCTNSTATAPTGAIDTPAQGGIVSGNVTNFGWVLSPSPRRADPPGGGTVQIVIDGAFTSAVPSGWTSRSDLTALFPVAQFPGIVNALGVASFDSTALANGVHTISWVVTDNLGSASGIGSRYFTVSNGSLFLDPTQGSVTAGGATVIDGPTSLAIPGTAALRIDSMGALASALDAAPGDGAAIPGRRGFRLDTPLEPYAVRGGRATVQAEELDRLELHLRDTPGDRSVGYLRVGDSLAPLPIGSSLNASTGEFTWAPGVGFVGPYDLVFVRWSGDQAVARQEVRVVLSAKGSTRVGPQTVIDTPASAPGTAVVGRSFVLAGWAADLDATVDRGVDTVHVWAYPATADDDPIWIGAATYGGARPDVAAVYGERFLETGYGITVQGLAPGTYDLAVFAYSTVTGGFVPAKTVRVTVR